MSLSSVLWLVFDEADRLFENGFEKQIDEIIKSCDNENRRCALFSATLPQRVEELARTVLYDPVRITIGSRNSAATTVDQRLVFVGKESGKIPAVLQIIREGIQPPVLIFTQSKNRASDLFEELVLDGLRVDMIHADRTKAQRDDIVRRFREGKIWFLIAY